MRILYITTLSIDDDSASLQRVIGVAAAWGASGHAVLIVGHGSTERRTTPFLNVQVEGVGASGEVGRVRRAFSANGISSWLYGYADPTDIVVVYGGTGRLTAVVKAWASRRGVPRVIDSVEWYEPSSLPGGRFGPRAIDNEWSMRRRFPKYDGAIVISRLLESHYRASGTREVVRVPPLVDTRAIDYPPAGERSQGPIRLLYAGSPGQKDSLGRVVRALGDLDVEGQHIRLQVLGVTPDEAMNLPEMPTVLPDSAEFRGRVKRKEVLVALRQAHFVPIIRRGEKYAHAGFSTKLVEAMSAGVAVLANPTSDVNAHITDGVTGVLVADASVASVRGSLERVLEIGPAAAEKMGLAAREHAQAAFDYRRHSDALHRFILSLAQESA